MNIPFDKVYRVAKMGLGARKDGSAPVRVAVYIDSTVSDFLIDSIRSSFVPQTTSGLVRVERLGAARIEPKRDNDVVLILSCGSDRLESVVQEIVIAGAPVCVLCESSVQASFITSDTPILGCIAASDKTYLLDSLARWILDRTEKGSAFAANFPFMRIAAANRAITSCALTNMATGALVFVPGADFPIMALSQLGMMCDLASIYGKPIEAERAYEAAGVLASGLALRCAARSVTKHCPHVSFAVKALVGGFGTYAIGRALLAVYERDVDYSRANAFVSSVLHGAEHVVSCARGSAPAKDTVSDSEMAA